MNSSPSGVSRGSHFSSDDDEALVSRAAHEPQAFVALYNHYAPRVSRYVLARIRNSSDADDILSAIWLRVYTKIHLYQPSRGSFAAWLFTIARHVLYNAVRQQARLEVRWPGECAAPAPDPQTEIIKQERDAAMRVAVSRLTAEQQEALALRYGADLTFAEVAQTMKKSEAAAKMLVRRALDRLRQELPKEMDDDA
jgi:RNA polymerase sigma-70 factor (ECF subfamily)